MACPLLKHIRRRAKHHFTPTPHRDSAASDLSGHARAGTSSIPFISQEHTVDKLTMTETIISTRIAKGVLWETMASDLGMSPVWLTSVCLGMNSAPAAKAAAIAEYLGLGPDVAKALEAFPTKVWNQTVPTDPMIYRLYEVVGVYGETLKEVIQEKFGDGIMSAIDFSMEVDKIEDPKGDRVLLTLNGKFLPYKSW